jgi:hypothetical protein
MVLLLRKYKDDDRVGPWPRWSTLLLAGAAACLAQDDEQAAFHDPHSRVCICS